MGFTNWYNFYRAKGFDNNDANAKARSAGVRTRGTRFRSNNVRGGQIGGSLIVSTRFKRDVLGRRRTIRTVTGVNRP